MRRFSGPAPRRAPRHVGHGRPADRRDRGIVSVVVALSAIAILGAAAISVDIASLYRRRAVLQNAIDFGALAGSDGLPATGAAAAADVRSVATDVVLGNAPGLSAANVTVDFRCIALDADQDGLPDIGQVPGICGPSTGTWSSNWVSKGTRVSHVCDPAAGDTCNAILVSASDTVRYYFAPIIGIGSGGTGTASAAGCVGGCGLRSSPLDLVLVFDRTASMTDADLANAKSAALAMVGSFDGKQQKVGLAVLPYGQPGNPCVAATSQTYPKSDLTWEAAPLANDYLNSDRSLNSNSKLVSTLNCIQKASFAVTSNLGPGHTDLGDPLAAAQTMLDTEGRPGVKDVIVLFTDGEANQPRGSNPCGYAVNKAKNIKNKGTEIYTIAYDVTGARCTTDNSQTYANAYATKFLADMATNSTDDLPGGCGATENRDRDHYFCQPANADLTPVFRSVAGAAISRASSLVDIDPPTTVPATSTTTSTAAPLATTTTSRPATTSTRDN